MPKINVYLPDDLAAAVKAAGFPVSPVCQRALAEAVRLATRSRAMIKAIRDPRCDQARLGELTGDSASPLTLRLHGVLESVAAAGAQVRSGTGELLLGLLDEEGNLGVRILRQALSVDLDELRAGVRQAGESGVAAGERAADLAERGGSGAGGLGAVAAAAPAEDGPSLLAGLTMPARNVVAAAIEAALELGHNYVGCEHLLLALAASAGTGTVAGRALADAGVQEPDVRRALVAALAGYMHGRQATASVAAGGQDEITRRLDALETRLAALGG